MDEVLLKIEACSFLKGLWEEKYTMDSSNREDVMICRRCNTNVVEAEPFDAIFKLNCNECATYRRKEARGEWAVKTEAALCRCHECYLSYRLKQPPLTHQCPRESVFPCIECSQQLYSEEDLRKHNKYVHKKGPVVKDEQRKVIRVGRLLLVVQKVASGSDACSRKVQSGPKRSRSNVTKGKRLKVKLCEYCSKTFTRMGDLKRHLTTHTGEKAYHCEICNSRFSTSSYLRKHIRMHNGEKPHQCKICQSKFSTSSSLKSHFTSIHTDEKPYSPYSCNICERRFSRHTHLTKHLQTHTGEKPHRCNICQRGFTQLCHLKVHLQIHTGERPYQCEICEKKCLTSGHLKTHLKTHTGERPYQCTICDKTWLTLTCLKRHFQTHTKVNDEFRVKKVRKRPKRKD